MQRYPYKCRLLHSEKTVQYLINSKVIKKLYTHLIKHMFLLIYYNSIPRFPTNSICRVVQWFHVRVIVDISCIVDYHCLNFLLIIVFIKMDIRMEVQTKEHYSPMKITSYLTKQRLSSYYIHQCFQLFY